MRYKQTGIGYSKQQNCFNVLDLWYALLTVGAIKLENLWEYY